VPILYHCMTDQFPSEKTDEQALEPEDTVQQPILPKEMIDALVVDNMGWAESIARTVARAWNLDWQSDGLDGAAYEALLFCARRYDPAREVPFRAYARRRVHEASSEAAKKSKGWRKSSDTADERTRELSSKILEMFPELRDGELPVFDDGGGSTGGDEAELRSAMRGLLVGASIAAAKLSDDAPDAESIMDFRTMLAFMAHLDLVHQTLLWQLYWEGESMRGLAEIWNVDELTIIREHKTLIEFLAKSFSRGKQVTKLKVRPTLKPIAVKLQGNVEPPFARFLSSL
jgi:hypothetical protein